MAHNPFHRDTGSTGGGGGGGGFNFSGLFGNQPNLLNALLDILAQIGGPLGFSRAGLPGLVIGSAFGNALSAGRIRGAQQRAEEQRDIGLGGAEEVQERTGVGALFDRVGFDQPLAGALQPFQSQFTSADAFRAGLPDRVSEPVGFEPIDVNEFRFDPTDITQLGERLGADIRGGAIDFGTLVSQSNVEGLTERAEERFPDLSAFRTERLGGIAEAAREAQTQAQQQISGQFGSLEEGQSELARRQFTGALSAGRAGSAVESEIERALGERAEFLGGLELDEVQIRQALSELALTDAQRRDIAGGTLEGQLGGRGQELLADSLISGQRGEEFNRLLQTDVDRFNRDFDVNLASQGATFQAGDESQAFNAFLASRFQELQGFLGASGFDVNIELAQLAERLGFNEAVPQLEGDSQTQALLDFLQRPRLGGGGTPSAFSLNPDLEALFSGL